MTDSENVQLVKKLLASFSDIARFEETIDDMVTLDIEWLNTGAPPVHGLEQAKGMLKYIGQNLKEIRVEYINIVEQGNLVWTERMDYLVRHDDSVLDCPDMGIFEIENGRVRSWRDYFDVAAFASM